MSSLVVDHHLKQHEAPGGRSVSPGKPVIVGIYGVPGCGKTFLFRQLKQTIGEEHFTYIEGSEMIGSIVPEGLEAFRKLEGQEKIYWRQQATDAIAENGADYRKVAVVDGHFIFWPEEQKVGLPVHTKNDLEMFSHILYLDVSTGVVAERRSLNEERSRPPTSSTLLRR